MTGKYDGAIYIDTAIETDGFVAGGKEVEAAARRMAKSVSGIGETAKIALQKQTDAFVKQNQQYVQQKQKVESLREKLKELFETKVETEEYKKLTAEMDKLDSEMDSVIQKQQDLLSIGFGEDDAYMAVEEDIERIVDAMDSVISKQKEMKENGAAYKTPDTSGIEQKLQAEKLRMQQMENALGTSYESIRQKVLSLGGSIGGIAKLNAAFADMENKLYMVEHPITSIKSAFLSAMVTMGDKAAGMAASLINGILHPLKNIRKLLGSVAGGVKKMAGMLMNAVKSFLGLNKASSKSSFGIKQALKSMLMYGVIGNVFRTIATGAKEGMQNLAQYSGETNASISSLMSALTQLKNSFATAFAPILNVVAPILTTFINLVSKAVTYVGMLIAALTGKSTFAKAVGVQQDYADSLNDSASAAENAKDASEDYLSGLDEVKKFETNDGGSGGSGGGGGGVSPGEMFETVDIGDQFTNLADKIKAAWEKADFTEIGMMVGDKINQALESIPWSQIQTTAGKIAKSLATFFNGAISGTDWSLVGNTIAQAFNTAFEFGYNFVTTFDWKKFGDSIADGINGFIKNLDTAKAAQGISEFIKGILDTCIRAINNTDWRMIGEKIREFLVNIDWPGIVSRLATVIGGAFGGFGAFLIGLFGDLLSGFYEKYIEPYVSDIQESGGDIVAGFLMGIGAAIADIGKWIYDNIFRPFLDGFKEAFGIHSPSTVMEEQGGYIIEGLFNGLDKNIGDVLDWFGELPDKVKDALGNAKKWLVDKGKDAIEGIKSGWESVKDSKLLSKVRELKNETFESIGTIAEKVKSKGSDIIAGMKSGYENSKESGLLSKVRKIGTETFSAVGNIGQTVKSKGTEIVSGLNEGYESSKQSGFLSGVDKIRNQVLSAIGSLSQVTKAKGTEIVSGLSDGLTGSFSKFTDIVASIPWHIANAIGDLYSVGKNAIQNFINGFKSLHIPTPHFDIGWSDVQVGNTSFKLPKFRGINWYKKGGLFSSPSVIGVGEAGKEAVLPIQNRKVMNLLADSIVSSMGNKLARMNVPYLASGAVIPPNAPFTAVLGDQKRGNNLETPEKLLRQLFREEFSKTNQKGGSYTFIGQINRRTLFEEMMTEAELVRSQTGMNPFEMA